MDTDQFITQYTGQQITNNGGAFKGECVSLAARYAQEVQNIPNADSVLYCQNTGGARDLWESPTDLELQYYDKIPPGSPQTGDLVIWGITMGTYGDVAVYIGDDLVFGQYGTPVFQPAATRSINPAPLGYLRLKGVNDMSTVGEVEFHDLFEAFFGPMTDTNQPTAHDRQTWIGAETNTVIREMQADPRTNAYNQYVQDLIKAQANPPAPPAEPTPTNPTTESTAPEPSPAPAPSQPPISSPPKSPDAVPTPSSEAVGEPIPRYIKLLNFLKRLWQ